MRADCSRCGVCTLLSWTLCIVNGVILPTLALILGVVYQGQCALQPYITVYLYVIAVLSIANFTFSITSACCIQRPGSGCYETCNHRYCFCLLLLVEILLNVMIFISLIAGSIWIYRLLHNIRNNAPWCNKTFYYLSFSLITTQWIMSLLQHVVTCTQTYFRQETEPPDLPYTTDASQIVHYDVIKDEKNNNRS